MLLLSLEEAEEPEVSETGLHKELWCHNLDQ